ncbi:hypothetical protein, partial [Streptococcus pneumoniae]|uniref:hypothetical protein n=1 Tax=Streptococcus pneumoniae TaxID=1313 RepID=UPI0018B08F94
TNTVKNLLEQSMSLQEKIDFKAALEKSHEQALVGSIMPGGGGAATKGIVQALEKAGFGGLFNGLSKMGAERMTKQGIPKELIQAIPKSQLA